jgi:hypothetical protein
MRWLLRGRLSTLERDSPGSFRPLTLGWVKRPNHKTALIGFGKKERATQGDKEALPVHVRTCQPLLGFRGME